ncbi:MAG: hypothetical protein KJS79_13895 [Rhodospirillales bacterium]|uniref:antitoxin Xre/MbcA/ParS-like domain-containing protein n=1 Tax=Acidiphilium multivorum TaxID=62140 RepID=UPI001F4C2F07|nr:hypothetical protein [Acidiphilium multivorum]MBU6357804.1 hypothetical protein [Rhodospirillales bacterium]UNC13891.1 hypothetical protein FE249_06445 [Acidiphilium multivorum]
MSTAKPSQLTRDILTKAIKSKVESMPLRDLVDLASALKIAVPMAAKTICRREPKVVAPPAAPGGRVLQGTGIGPVVSVAKGGRLLDAITVDNEAADWVESELIGAGAVVERLSIARGTLDNWRKAGKVVALRKGVRNFVYPLRQFDHRRPVDGLDLVAEHFTSAEEAWEWLVVPNRMTGGKAPIDALRAGDVKNVVSAAAAAFDYA